MLSFNGLPHHGVFICFVVLGKLNFNQQNDSKMSHQGEVSSYEFLNVFLSSLYKIRVVYVLFGQGYNILALFHAWCLLIFGHEVHHVRC